MRRDKIDRLIQLAYVEGAIKTRNAYENSVARKNPLVVLPEAKRMALQNRLEQALESARLAEDQPLTIGSLLRKIRAEHAMRPQDVFSRIRLSSNLYQLLERDRISPLRIPVDVWIRIRTLLNISVDELAEMVRRTHQLVFFRPSFRTTLARYDARKNKAMKASTLEKAASELYSKAWLDLPDAEKEKIERLLKSIAAGK
jgi:hypothetical protein